MNARDHTQDDGLLIRPDTAMLHPSPTNPRKRFDPATLADLAEGWRARHEISHPQGGEFSAINHLDTPHETEALAIARTANTASDRITAWVSEWISNGNDLSDLKQPETTC